MFPCRKRPARMTAAVYALLAWSLGPAGCAGSSALTNPTDSLPAGVWGGQHIGMMVAETAATVEFDCAHGKMDAPISLDSRGRFDVGGTYVLEHGGPVRPDEVADTRRARYAGSVAGTSMTLIVSLIDPASDVGTFSLTLGQTGRFIKCL